MFVIGLADIGGLGNLNLFYWSVVILCVTRRSGFLILCSQEENNILKNGLAKNVLFV